MTEAEIITGNDHLCQMLEFESNKVYVYKVPNLFPFQGYESGYMESNVQAILFHTDWNMLVGAYNGMLKILHDLPETGKQLLQEDKNFFARWGTKTVFMVSDVNYQINIHSAWMKLVDFAKWWNAVKLMIKTAQPPTLKTKITARQEAMQWWNNLTPERKSSFCSEAFLNRTPESLTGREIQLVQKAFSKTAG